MVSGKPPRRSKSTSEPVTIDLTAAVADEAGTAQSPDVAEGLLSPDQTPDETGKQAGDNSNGQPATDPETNASDNVASTATAAPKSSASPVTSGVIASGIFGGLVALLLAGSMQYAGLISAPGPEQTSTGNDSELAAIRSEIEKLASVQTPPAADPALEERIKRLEVAKENTPDPAALEQSASSLAELDDLRSQLTEAQSAIAALRAELVSNSEALNQNETRLSAAEQKLAEPRKDISMARAIALAGLKTAIERGGPFLSELDALKAVSPDDPLIVLLTDKAGAGLASRADLARNFTLMADQILETVHQPAQTEGWFDRLLASARSLVKVRPIGNVEGDSPEAIVARIENKLQNGDLQGAVLEWQELPDLAKNASQDFVNTLKHRIDAEAAIAKALSTTMAGTGE